MYSSVEGTIKMPYFGNVSIFKQEIKRKMEGNFHDFASIYRSDHSLSEVLTDFFEVTTLVLGT